MHGYRPGAHPNNDLHGTVGYGAYPTGGTGANSMNRITTARHGSGGGIKAPRTFTGNATQLIGTISMGFADGHTDAVKLTTLWDYTWHAKWQDVKPSTLTTLTAN